MASVGELAVRLKYRNATHEQNLALAEAADELLQHVAVHDPNAIQQIMNLRFIAHFRKCFVLTPQTAQLRVQQEDLPRMAEFVEMFNRTIQTITGFVIQLPDFEQPARGNTVENNRNRQKALQIFAIGFTVYTILLQREALPMEARYELIHALEADVTEEEDE